jgi:drug/metabolite transporter (DMT)-like permease
MTNLSERAAGALITLTAVLVLSPDALLISMVGTDAWTLVFWRGLLTASTLAVSLLTAHGKGVLNEGLRIGTPGVLVGLLFGASTISFVMSVRITTAANTIVIIAAMPLFAAVMTRVFLGERVPRRTWLAVMAGFAGIAVVFMGSLAGGHPFGDALALFTAVFMAANFVIIRRYRQVNMIPAVVLSGLFTTGVTLFLSTPFSLALRDILLLTAIGTVVLPIPLAILTVAPKLIPAAEVSLIMLLETFLGPFWVWLALGERPGRETVIGGSILIFTLVVHAWAGMKRP